MVDSIFRIVTVLEWVFQLVIPHSSFVLLSQHVDEMEIMSKKESKRGLKGSRGVNGTNRE